MNILDKIKELFRKISGNNHKMLEEVNYLDTNSDSESNKIGSLKSQSVEQTNFSPMKLLTIIEQDYFDSFKNDQDLTTKKLRQIFETNFQSSNAMASYIGRTVIGNDIRYMVINALNKRMSLDKPVANTEKSATEIYEQLRNGDSSNLDPLMQEVLKMYIGSAGVSVRDKIKELILKKQNGYELKPQFNTNEKQDEIIHEIVQTIILGMAEDKKLHTDIGKRLAIELTSTSRFDENLIIPNGGIECTFTSEDGKNQMKLPVTNGKEYKNYIMLNRFSFLHKLLKLSGREQDARTAQILEPRIQGLLSEYNLNLPEIDRRYLSVLEQRLNKARSEKNTFKIEKLTTELEKVKSRIQQRENSATSDVPQESNGNKLDISNLSIPNTYNLEIPDIIMENEGPLISIIAKDIIDSYTGEVEKLKELGITQLNKFNRYFFVRHINGNVIGRIETAVQPKIEDREYEEDKEH